MGEILGRVDRYLCVSGDSFQVWVVNVSSPGNKTKISELEKGVAQGRRSMTRIEEGTPKLETSSIASSNYTIALQTWK